MYHLNRKSFHMEFAPAPKLQRLGPAKAPPQASSMKFNQSRQSTQRSVSAGLAGPAGYPPKQKTEVRHSKFIFCHHRTQVDCHFSASKWVRTLLQNNWNPPRRSALFGTFGGNKNPKYLKQPPKVGFFPKNEVCKKMLWMNSIVS